MDFRLEIPHKSQKDIMSHLGHSAAILGMLTNESAREILAVLNFPKHKQFTLGDMMVALSSLHWSLPHYYDSRLDTKRIVAALRQNWPVIINVGYGQLPPQLKENHFDVSCFLLAVGFTEDALFMHDPFSPEGTGYKKIPFDIVERAIQNPGRGEFPNQGIVIKRPFPVQAEMGQTRLLKPPVTSELDTKTLQVKRLQKENKKLKTLIRMGQTTILNPEVVNMSDTHLAKIEKLEKKNKKLIAVTKQLIRREVKLRKTVNQLIQSVEHYKTIKDKLTGPIKNNRLTTGSSLPSTEKERVNISNWDSNHSSKNNFKLGK